MGVVYTARFYEYLDDDLPAEMENIVEEWHDELKGMRESIIKRLRAKIPDESAYEEKLAKPAYEGWKSIFNPYHPKFKKATTKFRTKVKKGAPYWLTNVYDAFQAGGNFEKGVEDNKGKFKQNVRLVWHFVGDKDKIVGMIPKVKYALRGHQEKINAYLDSGIGETQSGKAIPIFEPTDESMAVSAIEQKLIEMAYQARLLREAGEDDTPAINEFNNFAQKTISAYAKSEIDTNNTWVKLGFDSAKGRYYVDIQVATV